MINRFVKKLLISATSISRERYARNGPEQPLALEHRDEPGASSTSRTRRETAGGKKGKKPAATITISLAKNDGEYVMAVKDNGIGLPTGFDLETTQTLGLKLVNFLARHQMRAKVEVRREKGTEFVFRFRE